MLIGAVIRTYREPLCQYIQRHYHKAAVPITFGADWVPAIRLAAMPVWLPIVFYAGVLLLAPEPPLGEVEEF